MSYHPIKYISVYFWSKIAGKTRKVSLFTAQWHLFFFDTDIGKKKCFRQAL